MSDSPEESNGNQFFVDGVPMPPLNEKLLHLSIKEMGCKTIFDCIDEEFNSCCYQLIINFNHEGCYSNWHSIECEDCEKTWYTCVEFDPKGAGTCRIFGNCTSCFLNMMVKINQENRVAFKKQTAFIEQQQSASEHHEATSEPQASSQVVHSTSQQQESASEQSASEEDQYASEQEQSITSEEEQSVPQQELSGSQEGPSASASQKEQSAWLQEQSPMQQQQAANVTGKQALENANEELKAKYDERNRFEDSEDE